MAPAVKSVAKVSRFTVCASMVLLALVGVVQADTFNYPDYVGNTVKYTMITEETATPNVSGMTTYGLFGGPFGPTGVANSLDFNPVFSSFSSGAGEMDTTESTLSTMIEALPGNLIEALRFNEAGDVTLLGGDAGTFASVTADFAVDIVAVDGVMLGTPIQLALSMNMTPSDGDFDSASDAPLFPNGQSANWNGELTVDLTQALIDAGQSFIGGATKVNVSLSNVLMTKSQTGSSALIAKKDFGGTSISVVAPPVIPLPTSLALGILGLVGVIGWTGIRRTCCEC
jgi:hypothetical protein